MKHFGRSMIVFAAFAWANASFGGEPVMHRINWDYGGFAAVGTLNGSELRYCHTWDDPGTAPIAVSNCGSFPFVTQEDGLLRIDNIADGTMWFRIRNQGAAATFKNKNNGKTFHAKAVK